MSVTCSKDVESVGFHQTWFPVCLARELESGSVKGIDVLGTRVVCYRDAAGKPVVQSAWCPHLGADLSMGQIVEGQIRCPYHHWQFNRIGVCAHIPTADKIPPAARIFTYPAAEAWGLVWAFNGEAPLFDVPQIPGIEERDLAFETHQRGIRGVPPWVSTSNGIDFQHLRALHGIPTASAPEEIEVHDHSIEFRLDTADYMQHCRITGTNVSGQHVRYRAEDAFWLFASAPIDQQHSRPFFLIGVKKQGASAAELEIVAKKLEATRGFIEKLLAEDEPVLNTMRFRFGVMVGSDRHLSRYFKYVREFPSAPPALGR